MSDVNMGRKMYHHGNLREAIIDAALEVLRQKSAEAVGLREIARTIGVSSAAPYRHFDSRDALLSALATWGFEELERRLQVVVDTSGPAALAELGQAYVAFALEYRNLFGLMLRGERGERQGEALRAAGRSAFRILQAAVDGISGGETRADAIGAWSLVHGLAVLVAEQKLAPDLLERSRLAKLVKHVTETYERGLSTGRRKA